MNGTYEMYSLLKLIAVSCTDKEYAKQAEELVRKIRWSEKHEG